MQLGDDSVKIFLNTKGHIGDVSDEFRELIHFLDTSEKRKYKNELVNELIQDLAEGKAEEVFDSVYQNDYSVKRGAQKLNLSIEDFEKRFTDWKVVNNKE